MPVVLVQPFAPITADHNTHNTLGTCSNGVQTGNTKGAADLMFTDPPRLDAASRHSGVSSGCRSIHSSRCRT